MAIDGRWRRTVRFLAVALGGAALLGVGGASADAGAHPVSARQASCGSAGSGTIFSYGGGARTVSALDVPVCVTGRLTITFAGSAAAGCAAAGLCDYTGAETFAPQPGNSGDLNLTTMSRHGHRSIIASLSLGGPDSALSSAVQRTVSSGTTTVTTSCSDNAGSPQQFGPSFPLTVTHGRVTIALDRAQPALLGSRCAGPLDGDLASVLPSQTVSLRALQHGRRAIDLTGGGPFSAHGLSGTVASTLVLTLGRPQSSRIVPAAPKGTTRVRTIRTGTVDYRITALTGQAAVNVQGSGTPAACGPFDACGLGGTITVAPGPLRHGSLFVTAIAHRDVSLRQLRAELRGAGPLHTKLYGGGPASVSGSVQAVLTQGGAGCTDSVALRQFSVGLVRVGPRVTVSLTPSLSQAADPLRTRCPGPDLGTHPFAVAHLPASVLAHPSFTVALRGVPFTDGPYSVAPSSTLRLTLRRGATHVHVTRIPEPKGAAGHP